MWAHWFLSCVRNKAFSYLSNSVWATMDSILFSCSSWRLLKSLGIIFCAVALQGVVVLIESHGWLSPIAKLPTLNKNGGPFSAQIKKCCFNIEPFHRRCHLLELRISWAIVLFLLCASLYFPHKAYPILPRDHLLRWLSYQGFSRKCNIFSATIFFSLGLASCIHIPFNYQ